MSSEVTGRVQAVQGPNNSAKNSPASGQVQAGWKPFDAAVWLLDGRWGCVNGWSVISTPEEWAGTVLLNGTRYRVTITEDGDV